MSSDTGIRARADAPALPGDRAGDAQARRRRRAVALLLPVVLLAVAATLRFYRLADPPRIYFDEIYYVEDARELLAQGVESGFAVHPPLGKWLIAGGMAVAGDGPAGWRVAAATAGSLAVVMTYLAGLRLFRRRGVAALAALLVAVDGLAYTMSRIAMLDAFVALFVVTGFWLLLIDRDRLWAHIPGGPDRPSAHTPGGPAPPSAHTGDAGDATTVLPARPHAYRWLAGLAFGCALAVKWSALLAVGAAVLFVLGSELAWRRRVTGRPLAHGWRAATSAAVTLVAVPIAVYVGAHAGWFANFEQTRMAEERCPGGGCTFTVPEVAGAWLAEQRAILEFHRELTADHPYEAPATAWPALNRPVAYYYESCPEERLAEGTCVVESGNVAVVLSMGNPAIWWLALVAYPVVAALAVARRDWRAWAVLAFLLALYLPWLAAGRPLFFFYLTPAVPFIALALATAAGEGGRHPLLRWVPAAVAALAVAGFLYWYPVLSALEVPHEVWWSRMWLDSWV